MKKKILAGVLVVLVAGVGFLYFPRGSVVAAANAAVLGVLSAGVDASRAGADFLPAFDGDVFATGDAVRADKLGRAVLTFFDGSTISVDPGSKVRVASLSKMPTGAIQLTLEQSAGRTWASVSKLASPDSKFEIRTPSMVATVRGTTFETIVETQPDGKVVTTIKTNEGEVLVQAQAGGEVRVPAGTQVDVKEDQPAPPAAQPQPPTPKLRVSGPAGVGFVVIDPRGLQCGAIATGTQRQIPRCDVLGGAGQSVVIGEVVAGTYTLVVTAAQAVPDLAIVAEGLGVQATDFTVKATASMKIGDLLRLSLPVTVGADGKLGSTGFTPPELISSVCGAEAGGRVFSGGGLTERADALVQFAGNAKAAPAAIVYTGQELTDYVRASVRDQQAQLPVTISDVKVDVDNAGVHMSANVAAGPINLTAKGDVIAGVQDGRLVMKLRNIDAGILPPAAKDQVASVVENGLSTYVGAIPLTVQRVAFRAGCFALIGKTPG